MKIQLPLIFIIIFAVLCLQIKNVLSQAILKVYPLTEAHVELLKSIENDKVLFAKVPNLNKTINIGIADSTTLKEICRLFTDQKLQFDQIQNSSKSRSRETRSRNSGYKFLTWQEYEDWIQSLKALNNSLITVEIIGKSVENRNIYSIKFGIGDNSTNALFESGAHAREWLAAASVIGTVQKIIKSLDEPKKNFWKYILTKYNLYFVPILNPDGYVYTAENIGTRLWRKNRQNISSQTCSGIDINRNFPMGFENNTLYCGQEYSGSYPFQSPEARSLKYLVEKILKNLRLYISFHCYGQFIFLPWGFTHIEIPDYADLKDLARIIQETIFNNGKNNYTIGTPPQLLYTAGGTSYDWIKSLGVPYSYTIELFPDTNSSLDFVVPETYIEPTIREVYETIKVALAKLT